MENITKDILGLASEGDIDSFEKIYRAACGFVYNVVLRVTGNREDAEEITQDVFLKVYRNLKKFHFSSSFKTWVYRIAVNTALNHHNRELKQQKYQAKIEYDCKTEFNPLMPEDMEDKEKNIRQVDEFLAQLSADQRTCLILRTMEGLSYQEIADVLQININTVRTRLKRAREKLLALREEVIKNELQKSSEIDSY
ncbi:MAG: hypothetical protein A2W05_00765 [Candidatus Schekmanbacteria bacterium RBG_16_38_10]|uniref:HTH luxR-type domain-containing protein n=1 Tax=Candidatus Schekmanbacteria bacterium RBG_16_38_10 TaxID=1817879 RepID=A0A1F7RQJ4_9BACT|nr:MAG: hypothetical protein A2W05_00765 [Candidatus Schekmanbacteria bacterium RBG_16_38_10]